MDMILHIEPEGMNYTHKFIHYSIDLGYKIHLHFSNKKLSEEKIIDLLEQLCIAWGDEVEDELIVEPFGDSKIEGSEMKMYTESMGDEDWFCCYCGTVKIKETIKEDPPIEVMRSFIRENK